MAIAHNLRVKKGSQIPRRDAFGAGGAGVGGLNKREGCEHESELQADIRAECRRRGWLCLGGSMAHKTRRTLGEMDFIILTNLAQRCRACDNADLPCYYCAQPNAGGGRVLFIECKTRLGKPSPAQLALHAHAQKLGHRVHVVRSLTELIDLL